MSGFVSVLRRDLRLTLRQGTESLMVVMFFVIAVVLFPLGVGPEPNILARIARHWNACSSPITRTGALSYWPCSPWHSKPR